MPPINPLRALKAINFSRSRVSFIIVEKYISQRAAHYTLKHVQTNDLLKTRLRNIVLERIQATGNLRPYTVDAQEPDEDEACFINSDETDFHGIYEQYNDLNPEEGQIEGVEDLSNAKAYMIILKTAGGDEVIGFRKIPESWKLKKERGIISMLFRENRFEDLGDDNVFSISDTVDILYFNDRLFIYSLKAFERAMNFREGMMANAEDLYQEVETLRIFTNPDVLRLQVGNNQRYLRKIAVIKNLGHYRNLQFLQKLERLNAKKGWNILFEGGQITFTEETIDTILTVLQDKRLHSELTDQDFDVPSATPLQ